MTFLTVTFFGCISNATDSDNPLQWAKSNAGFGKNFIAIQCTPSESGEEKASTATFTGDLDGSDNWQALCETVDDWKTDGNYPAWEWVNAYSKNNALSGEYARGWYLPTIAELCMLYRAKDTVNAALETADGTKIADTVYWSSSQYSSNSHTAWIVRFSDGTLVDFGKNFIYLSVCAVRAFN